MIVAIDAGHGITTAGKRIPTVLRKYAYGGESVRDIMYREHYLNDRIAQEVRKKLRRKTAIDSIATYDEDNHSDVSLKRRCEYSNSVNTSIFISIHHNAGINGGNGGGIMVYYYPTGYIKRKQANTLYNNLVENTGLRGNRISPVVGSTNLYVLKHTKAPAFLIECGFMDAPNDIPTITSNLFVTQASDAIVEFCEEWLRTGGKF